MSIRQTVASVLDSQAPRRPVKVLLGRAEFDQFAATSGQGYLSDAEPYRFAYPLPDDPSFSIPVELDANLTGGRAVFSSGPPEDFG
jgi:hypothetical protein